MNTETQPTQPTQTQTGQPVFRNREARRLHLAVPADQTVNRGDNLPLPRSVEAVKKKGEPALCCTLEVAPGVSLIAYALGDDVYVDAYNPEEHNPRFWSIGHDIRHKAADVEPFISARIVGKAQERYRNVQVRRSVNYFRDETVSEQRVIAYEQQTDWRNKLREPGIPYAFIPIEVTAGEDTATQYFAFRRPLVGNLKVPQGGNHVLVDQEFYGLPHSVKHVIYNDRSSEYDCERAWKRMAELVKAVERGHINATEKEMMGVWSWFLDGQMSASVKCLKTLHKERRKGLLSLEKRKKIRPNLDRLAKEEPVLFKLYLVLHDSKTRKGVTTNQLLGAVLREHGEDYEVLKGELAAVLSGFGDYERNRDWHMPATRTVALMMPSCKEKLRKKRAKQEWHQRKDRKGQAEGLGITKETAPRLLKAIENGDIPMGIFHEPGQPDTLVNVEFDLWERALKRKGWAEVLSGIAQDASRRSTYTHQIASYIVFLFHIEKYLGRHTPGRKKWKAFPKFVESQWELEMEAPTEEGTVKRRSALTPIVDNENRTITVPYASLQIYGRQTTYCYSDRYFVFEEGLNDPEGLGVVTKDLEEKLNGRDDYGLMFFTLTGTDRNRGYPTFLIIFERTTQHGTRVHFHRVHPNRSKRGVPTPTSRLIQECYRYMAGNVRAEEIEAQQGDLLFIPSNPPVLKDKAEPLAVAKAVADFESHAFLQPEGEDPVVLVANQAKSIKNRLGHVHCPHDFTVRHPEHEDVDLKAGWYEVRRCKSFEANPQSVWSFTID